MKSGLLSARSDQVLVIDHGRIIERGDHESLLAQRGFYHRLYLNQFKGHRVSLASGAPPKSTPWTSWPAPNVDRAWR